MIQNHNIPDDKGEESSNDEDIIKHGKSDEEPVESLLEFFPLHNEYSDSVAWKHDASKDIFNRIDDYCSSIWGQPIINRNNVYIKNILWLFYQKHG